MDENKKTVIPWTIGKDFEDWLEKVREAQEVTLEKSLHFLMRKKTGEDPENEWITDLKLLPQWEFDVLVKLKAAGVTFTYLGYYCIDELRWTIHGETRGFQTDEVLAWRFIPRFNDV